jgi:predicted PurR-regulated permease PerM
MAIIKTFLLKVLLSIYFCVIINKNLMEFIMPGEFYLLLTSLIACFIIWIIWFTIARKKANHGAMIAATYFCCFSLITLWWGALAGLFFLGMNALIDYIKKLPISSIKEKKHTQEPQQLEISLFQETTYTPEQGEHIKNVAQIESPANNTINNNDKS